jgi:hypothetical protein
MVSGTYEALFAAVAATAAALTGLLFVAISVSHTRPEQHGPKVIYEVRAAASLISFTSALAVALFGLVPGNHVGYPAAIVGVTGLFFTLAGLRSILVDPDARRERRHQVGLIILLLLTFGFELGTGIDLIMHPRDTAPLDILGNLLVASLLIGIARAWELVGDRDTGIIASITTLTRRSTGKS